MRKQCCKLFCVCLVERLLSETDLKVVVFNGQLDLIVSTPGPHCFTVALPRFCFAPLQREILVLADRNPGVGRTPQVAQRRVLGHQGAPPRPRGGRRAGGLRQDRGQVQLLLDQQGRPHGNGRPSRGDRSTLVRTTTVGDVTLCLQVPADNPAASIEMLRQVTEFDKTTTAL